MTMFFEGKISNKDFEEKVISTFSFDRISKRKTKEEGNVPGAYINLTLYYTDGRHSATWRGDTKTGWIYQVSVDNFKK